MDSGLFPSNGKCRIGAWIGVIIAVSAWRPAAGEVQPFIPDLVFVSRDLGQEPQPGSRSSAIERAASGKLFLRRASGELTALAGPGSAGAGTIADVMDPDVSFDARHIVFAGYSLAEGAWRIFEIGADGAGLRQITRSDRAIDLSRYGPAAALFESYDDIDPFYLPDGRIGFISTRYPGAAPDGRLRTTNLYVVNADGSDLHRITTERFGADTPVVDPSTGQIVYSRFWRSAQLEVDPGQVPPEPIPPGSPGYEDIVFEPSELPLRGVAPEKFPGVNSWFLASIDPDGTDLAMYTGFRLDRELTQAYRPSFLENEQVLALFIPRTPFYGFPRGNGLRLFSRGPGMPQDLGGPQSFASAIGEEFDPAVDPALPIMEAPLYASAAPLADGWILVTAALDPAAPDYGIFFQKADDSPPSLIHNSPGTAELDAIPLTARPVPPVIADSNTTRMEDVAPQTIGEAFASGGSFTFLSENIFLNASVDVPIPNAPPAGKKLTIDFFMAPQRTSTTGGDAPILIRSLTVPQDGRIETELPAGVPLFEALRRGDGSFALGRDGQVFHVGSFNFGRAGETARCVGCHAGHTQISIPADPTWTNLAPSAFVSAKFTRLRNNLPRQFFIPSNLVDRRTDRRSSEWAIDEVPVADFELTWSATIRAREMVLYGTAPGGGTLGTRDQMIHAFTVTTFRDRAPQQSFTVNQDVLPAGTRVALDPGIDIDSLKVTIRSADVTGLYEGKKGVALAEVEVIARVTGEPQSQFIRGDVDCNTRLDISDPIQILARLFLGLPELCCEAAADVNDDGLMDISDPIAHLGFLFLGSFPPAPPFPLCGPVTSSHLTCSKDVCF